MNQKRIDEKIEAGIIGKIVDRFANLRDVVKDHPNLLTRSTMVVMFLQIRSAHPGRFDWAKLLNSPPADFLHDYTALIHGASYPSGKLDPGLSVRCER